MKCLVTGGAGFIGSHLVDRLLKNGHEVVVIDDFSTGKEENLSQHKGNKNLQVYRRSICDNLTDLFFTEKFDVVFHLAAIASVQFSIQEPIKTHETNVNGSLNLLNCCKKFNVKRFVFSSSAAVYGDQESLPLRESMKPNPLCPYALHKLIIENYCKLFYKLYGIETVCLRYFNVYGPRQDLAGVYALLIPKFIQLIPKNESPTINGDGEQTRDFVYVEDVVDAILAAGATQNKECFGQVFNSGSGKNTSVNEVASQIIKLSGKNITPKHGPALNEIKDSLPDINKAKTLLGWEPKVGFEEGLKETYKYFAGK
jgi:UDP-glucose 4-epimerase